MILLLILFTLTSSVQCQNSKPSLRSPPLGWGRKPSPNNDSVQAPWLLQVFFVVDLSDYSDQQSFDRWKRLIIKTTKDLETLSKKEQEHFKLAPTQKLKVGIIQMLKGTKIIRFFGTAESISTSVNKLSMFSGQSLGFYVGLKAARDLIAEKLSTHRSVIVLITNSKNAEQMNCWKSDQSRFNQIGIVVLGENFVVDEKFMDEWDGEYVLSYSSVYNLILNSTFSTSDFYWPVFPSINWDTYLDIEHALMNITVPVVDMCVKNSNITNCEPAPKKGTGWCKITTFSKVLQKPDPRLKQKCINGMVESYEPKCLCENITGRKIPLHGSQSITSSVAPKINFEGGKTTLQSSQPSTDKMNFTTKIEATTPENGGLGNVPQKNQPISPSVPVWVVICIVGSILVVVLLIALVALFVWKRSRDKKYKNKCEKGQINIKLSLQHNGNGSKIVSLVDLQKEINKRPEMTTRGSSAYVPTGELSKAPNFNAINKIAKQTPASRMATSRSYASLLTKDRKPEWKLGDRCKSVSYLSSRN